MTTPDKLTVSALLIVNVVMESIRTSSDFYEIFEVLSTLLTGCLDKVIVQLSEAFEQIK